MLLLTAVTLAAADPSTTDLVKFLATASGPTILAIIVVGAIKEWWIPGKTHHRILQERDELLDLVVGSQKMGIKAVDIASFMAEVAKNAKAPDS